MDQKLLEILESNKEALEIFKDKKTLEAMMAIKEVFVEKVLERGDMRVLILDAIAKKPKHGYQIIVSISRRFEGLYRPSAGTVYPTLQSLEEEGLIGSKELKGKKTYTLTNRGEAYLKRNQRRVGEIFSNFEDCYFGRNPQFSKRMQCLVGIWIQMAYEVFFKTRGGLRAGDPDLDRRMARIETALKKTLKELKEVWK